MYRNSDVYDEIKKTIIDIFLDYDIRSFPIDEREICAKMGVALVPYSDYDAVARDLMLKQSLYGFFLPRTTKNPPIILYNDSCESKGARRFTIFHELKHYVCEDTSDNNDDIADFFARYFMCPIPLLLLKKMDNPYDIATFCDTSLEVGYNVNSNIKNRRKAYGYQLFDYEEPLIKQLDPELYDIYVKGVKQYDCK